MIKFLLSILGLIRYKENAYDKGRHLEYLTYKSLRRFEKHGGKFLFNLFIPKIGGETTEIDVCLICSKGIFVFECKNFSGWIFGNETQKRWTQTLPVGRGRCHREQFYNPVMQNASHIRHLKNFIGKNVPMWSIIVFSDRCVFKDITVSNNVNVINHSEISSVVTKIYRQMQDIYSDADINDMYNMLHRYA